MRYIVNFLQILILLNLLFLNLIKCDCENKQNEQLTVIEQNLDYQATNLKESESGSHKKLDIKEEKGQKENFQKENDYGKKDQTQEQKKSNYQSDHENLKATEEDSKLKKKQSDQLGHDEGKKSASKTKKSGDNLDLQWDRGSGFVKQWNFDKGSKKKKSSHIEDEEKLRKYNKAYKQEKGMLSKGHHAKFKKHDSGHKNSWDSNLYNHNKKAYNHNFKKNGANYHHGYHTHKKANEEGHRDNGWNQVWHKEDQPKYDHASGYDWRFK